MSNDLVMSSSDPLSARLQKQCSEWGTYWRSSDSHGVNLTVQQATELLRDALGVEVDIASPEQPKFEVRVAGPDDVIPFADELAAHRHANDVNRIYLDQRLKYPDPDDEVLCVAVVHTREATPQERRDAAEAAEPAANHPAPGPAAEAAGEQVSVAPEARDPHIGGSSYEASMLRNLLARIHGDGGHYVHQHGLDKALEEAEALVAGWRGTPAASEGAAQVPDELRGLDTATRVRFYEHDFYVLSNFSAFRLLWRGRCWDTSEAAYHSEKFPRDPELYDLIRDAPSAHAAFKIAEANKARRRPDWDAVKVDIMRKILRAKARQHEYVRRKLLATGDRELVEDSWRDDFWGWGPNRDGRNMLGRLWMEIRAELRAAPAAPPPAPDTAIDDALAVLSEVQAWRSEFSAYYHFDRAANRIVRRTGEKPA